MDGVWVLSRIPVTEWRVAKWLAVWKRVDSKLDQRFAALWKRHILHVAQHGPVKFTMDQLLTAPMCSKPTLVLVRTGGLLSSCVLCPFGLLKTS